MDSQPLGQPAALPLHDPATASLLLATLNSQRQVGQKFLIVVVADDDWPHIHEYEDINTCIEEIKQWIGTNTFVFAFMGQRMPISAGPNSFLQTPMGPMPLFDIPEAKDFTEAEYGWLGDELHTEQPPQTAEPLTEEDEPDAVGEDSSIALIAQSNDPVSENLEEDDTPLF